MELAMPLRASLADLGLVLQRAWGGVQAWGLRGSAGGCCGGGGGKAT